MREVVIDKLTKAFDFIMKEKNETGCISNPLVISQLQSKDGNNAYLIAKTPEQDLFYGLLESPHIKMDKQIMGIPSSNLEGLELFEVSFRPFRLKKYLNEGVKEYMKDDIIWHYFFMNPHFKKDLIDIKHSTIEDRGKFMSYLRFNKQIQSLPIIFLRTRHATRIISKENNRFIFEFEDSFLGLPTAVNVFILMQKLITHCYGVQTAVEFINKVHASNDPLLIHLLEIIEENFNNNFTEIIMLMQRPELNPRITINDIIYGKTKSSLLVFNHFAYDNIFKNYIS